MSAEIYERPHFYCGIQYNKSTDLEIVVKY